MARQKLMLNSPSPPPAQSDQSKPILVIVSIKPLTYQSFRQNHFFPAKFIEQFFIYEWGSLGWCCYFVNNCSNNFLSTRYNRVPKCDVIENEICEIMGFVKIFWKNNVQGAYSPTISNLEQIVSEILAQLCSGDSIQILLNLTWFLILWTEPNFRRICMESSQHNLANISETICPELLIFGE